MGLLVKDSENGARGVACLQLGGEWMCEKILLCTPLVRFQCIMEYYLKVGGWSGGRTILRHDLGVEDDRGDSGELTRSRCASSDDR